MAKNMETTMVITINNIKRRKGVKNEERIR